MSILPQPKPYRQFGKQLLDRLLPGSCLLCAGDSGDELLCEPCAGDLPTLPKALCPQCCEQTTHGERCGACLHQPPHFDDTLALFRYDFPADRLIHALKYAHQLAVAKWLGERLAGELGGRHFDLLIPLPLHADRLRERGFNQSVEIARTVGHRLHLPLDHEHVVRNRATPPQAELARKERHRNVKNAFDCLGDFSGKHLLLIDDVMTSGATLSECARVLKLHGAVRVSVAVAARALKH